MNYVLTVETVEVAYDDIRRYGHQDQSLNEKCKDATAADCGAWDFDYTVLSCIVSDREQRKDALMAAYLCRAWATVKITEGDTTAREATPQERIEWQRRVRNGISVPAI